MRFRCYVFSFFFFLQRSTHSKSETIRILISRRKYWTQLLLEILLKPHNVIIIRYYHCIMNDGKSRISQDRISAMEESERVVIFRWIDLARNDFKRGWRRSKVAVRRGMRHVSSREFPRLGLPWQRDLTRLGAKQREPL